MSGTRSNCRRRKEKKKKKEKRKRERELLCYHHPHQFTTNCHKCSY